MCAHAELISYIDTHTHTTYTHGSYLSIQSRTLGPGISDVVINEVCQTHFRCVIWCSLVVGKVKFVEKKQRGCNYVDKQRPRAKVLPKYNEVCMFFTKQM